MTYDKTTRMMSLKKNEQIRTHRKILNAISNLEEASSSEIHKFIATNKTPKKSKNEDASQIDFYGFEVNKDKTINDQISLRTVQRNLVELVQLGLIKHTGTKYSLTDEVRAGRFFGKEFGIQVLNNIIPTPNFELKTVKENLEYLITLFGTILTFCCLEAARPKRKLKESGDDDAYHQKQLAATISWINSIINPSSLFHYFLFVFRNQVDDDRIKKLKRLDFYGLKRGKNIWIDKKTGKEYNMFGGPSMHPIFVDDKGKLNSLRLYQDIPFEDEYPFLDRFSSVYTEYDNKPYDEVALNTYNKMVKALKELVPELSSKLEPLRVNKKHVLDYLDEN